MKPPICIDVDGVCADFMEAVLSFINTQHGTNFKNEEMWDDFRVVLKQYHDTPLENFIKSQGFCQLLKVIPGSQEFVEKVRRRGHRVIFLTSPYKDAPTWSHDRMKWLKKHFEADREDIILAKDKRFVNGLTLIDDLPKNCIDWHQYQKRTSILLAQPWNKKDFKEVESASVYLDKIEIALNWEHVEEIVGLNLHR